MAQNRLYSLFEKQPDGTWKRIRESAYFLRDARKLWQNALLDGILHGGPVRELRPVKEAYHE